MGSILKALNLSVFVAFWLSFLEPGIRALEALLGMPVRDNLPTSDESLLHAYLDWFIPAFLLYFLFRFAQFSKWFRVTPATHTQLLVANALIVSLFFLAASGDPSAGIVFAIFLGLPAIVFSLTGTLTLIFKATAAKESKNPSWREPFSARELYSSTLIALLVSFVFGGPVFLSKNSGVQLLSKNRDWISENCKSAGVRISRKFSGALLIDESMERNIGQWKLPGMRETDRKQFKQLLLDESAVSRVEWREFDYRSKTWKYFSYQRGNPDRVLIDAPSARYVIGTKRIVDKEVSETRNVSGESISISDVSTGRAIATLTYFSSRYPQAYCGQSIGEFDLVGFISQAYEG
jgi:hypothetical protein